MKIAVSIPDPVFEKVEDLALRLRKTRDELYSEALSEYFLRYDADAVTDAMNAVCDAIDTRPAPLLSSTADRVLKQTEW